jgi:uncharacterized protein (DUF2141 family)
LYFEFVGIAGGTADIHDVFNDISYGMVVNDGAEVHNFQPVATSSTMKTFILTLIFICSMASWYRSYAQSTLVVNIKNIKNKNGDILIGLYDSTSNFPRKVATGKVVKVTDKEMHITFENIKPGNYAVSVLHDENQNKDLDRSSLGMPKEGYGFSNNVMGVMGPPSFRKARFYIPAGESAITIKMKYRKK